MPCLHDHLRAVLGPGPCRAGPGRPVGQLPGWAIACMPYTYPFVSGVFLGGFRGLFGTVPTSFGYSFTNNILCSFSKLKALPELPRIRGRLKGLIQGLAPPTHTLFIILFNGAIFLYVLQMN